VGGEWRNEKDLNARKRRNEGEIMANLVPAGKSRRDTGRTEGAANKAQVG